MRFRSQLTNIVTFTSKSPPSPIVSIPTNHPPTELTASLSSLGKVCWMRLEDGIVRFTIIPDQGTQVWAQLPVVRTPVPRLK
jgi:HUS1 checkpoint protein